MIVDVWDGVSYYWVESCIVVVLIALLWFTRTSFVAQIVTAVMAGIGIAASVMLTSWIIHNRG